MVAQIASRLLAAWTDTSGRLDPAAAGQLVCVSSAVVSLLVLYVYFWHP